MDPSAQECPAFSRHSTNTHHVTAQRNEWGALQREDAWGHPKLTLWEGGAEQPALGRVPQGEA